MNKLRHLHQATQLVLMDINNALRVIVIKVNMRHKPNIKLTLNYVINMTSIFRKKKIYKDFFFSIFNVSIDNHLSTNKQIVIFVDNKLISSERKKILF